MPRAPDGDEPGRARALPNDDSGNPDGAGGHNDEGHVFHGHRMPI